MKKRIVLCADDYGQAQPVSQGILKLLELGRLSAVSCITNMAYWQEHALWLSPFYKQTDLGLHFNLTEGRPLSSEYAKVHGETLLSLPQLLGHAFLGKLNKTAIMAECHAQIDRFQEVIGKLPDYLDGHHHVHQFPIIRDALLKVYEQRLRPHQAYIRLAKPTLTAGDLFLNAKKSIILISGAIQFKNLLHKNKIPYNQSFTGIYRFATTLPYKELVDSFFKEIADKGLMMCHPALAQTSIPDTMARARYTEYQYLASPDFLLKCRHHGVEIHRFSTLRA